MHLCRVSTGYEAQRDKPYVTMHMRVRNRLQNIVHISSTNIWRDHSSASQSLHSCFIVAKFEL